MGALKKILVSGACAVAATVALGQVGTASSTASAPPPLQFTILRAPATQLGASRPLAPIPPGFVGASIDYCQIVNYMHGPGSPQLLANLLRALAPTGTLLRIGGEGPEEPCPNQAEHRIAPELHAIRGLLSILPGLKLILGVNLRSHNVKLAESDAAELLRALDPWPPHPRIAAFELGNEPDLDPRYGSSVPAYQVGPYFDQYLRDYTAWAHAIRAATKDRGLPVAGPSLGRFGLPWITGPYAANFRRFADGRARPRYLTFHRYALYGINDPCPHAGCPSMTNLLAEGASRGLAAPLSKFVDQVPLGSILRVDEMNSITAGGTAGVSNTMASALWALDTAFELAQAGVGGINFHTFPHANYALFSNPYKQAWLVHPSYYGLLMFDRAAPPGSVLQEVTPSSPAPGAPNVKVWATRDGAGRLRVLIINKSIVAQQVLLAGTGLPSHRTASLVLLQAAPGGGGGLCPPGYFQTGMCATGGLRLGGSTFGPPDLRFPWGDATRTGSLPPSTASCATPLPRNCRTSLRAKGTSVVVPAASALLLTQTQ